VVGLAVIYLPIAFFLIAQLEQTVFGVVAFSTVGADEEGAEVSSFAVIFFRDREGGTATARDHVHAVARAIVQGSTGQNGELRRILQIPRVARDEKSFPPTATGSIFMRSSKET
jgi:hypothetical protein